MEVLDILATHGVKAMFFLTGSAAAEFPALARRISEEGHGIGTHTQNHPLPFAKLPEASAKREIEDGIASIAKVLGDPERIAPFFRFPGLGRTLSLENYVRSRSLSTWSADVVADDWLDISSQQVVQRALFRIDRRKNGILLLHDIQHRTALALPWLLRELKERDYRFVQVLARP
jgi:peptidoglycan/xylan/chitin deacetylase (PgdA/CDA1 family)